MAFDACDYLSIEAPVIQAAMGGVSRSELVCAVSNAGGLGSLGYLPAPAFETEMKTIEERLEGRPFAVNLLLPIISAAHVEVCVRRRPPIVSFFYGFNQKYLDAVKASGAIVLFQVGDLAEARRVFAAGADGVIAQGVEAGGHVRGVERLSALLPKVKEAFPDRLVIGAGGVFDAASAQACRATGADAVCAGTRFLATPESHAHDAYKRRLLDADRTVLTNLFGVGWRDPHRVAPNAAVEKWLGDAQREPWWLPTAHAATRLLSKVASSEARTEKMVRSQFLRTPLYTPAVLTPELPAALADVTALYAGECVKSITSLMPAADVVRDLRG